ncbi:neuronal calcium sensor 2 [Patella vulgata]|uniref:neuronal calcium sensor 2 n=1 Tax=Patella vulgata TaxID=6465 RepID=UPI0021807D18|nr:neuronal calcium sensor 2 [Patella vulgata]XP_050403648.1 neuronal calcium sensor 2 [Patella vulgata]XP_050403649.1 neuronal calcium sensor 2 [Patella vulgata]XP_050403650.1 neuronal calcium sensor 2 [Patella vulgata]XP_050403651.1 neuronal calcium sensor 2 [Patella vulgata]XP_050403653.1 neuronal calcium sensor 2 [Patella vulgata]XP_050403654.1 neuronal calcium sensor 2 [Patella vulgata]
MGNSGSKKTKLSKEDLYFLETNTNFEKAEIKQWYKGFMRDCPSGTLSKEKFKEVYSQFFPGGDPKDFCEHVFRSFDKDHSGSIEFKEFLLAINITSQKGKAEDKLNWAFDMYDIDGNGTIDHKEMESIIQAIYSMLGAALVGQSMDTPSERTVKIFEKMDSNGDGVLTKEEFIQGCLNDQCLYQMLTADASKE